MKSSETTWSARRGDYGRSPCQLAAVFALTGCTRPRPAGTLVVAAYVQCPCRQYIGPEPTPAVFSPGLELPQGGAL